MSAESFVAFYGLRYSITIEEFEDSNDWRVRAARKARLKCYSGNFGGEDENLFLFVGTPVGIFGAEGEMERAVSSKELSKIVESTNAKLESVGLNGAPYLYLQWHPDS